MAVVSMRAPAAWAGVDAAKYDGPYVHAAPMPVGWNRDGGTVAYAEDQHDRYAAAARDLEMWRHTAGIAV